MLNDLAEATRRWTEKRILVISRVKAAGSSTSALASASGLSRTMAMSISPPSFWIRAGRPACICARIATALFSHRVRSHSSKALCARVQVCGGALWAVGVPNARMKGLSCSVEDGRFVMAATQRKMSPSLISYEAEDFCPMAGSESAQSCRSVYPVFGSIYLLFHTAL